MLLYLCMKLHPSKGYAYTSGVVAGKGWIQSYPAYGVAPLEPKGSSLLRSTAFPPRAKIGCPRARGGSTCESMKS